MASLHSPRLYINRLRMEVEMHRPHLSQSQRQEIIDSMMIAPTTAAIERFVVIMFLSVVVATVGLVQNSAAVVIGGMMIAPLMSPILGISASMLMGWRKDFFVGVALIFASVIATVVVAMLIAIILPQSGIAISNEVLARTSFDVRDLVVALAAGAAGTYALFHKSISGALPGVAVAVALLPPLATVGILLGRDQPNLAMGAALLFITNIFGIMLGAVVVMLISGFVPPHTVAKRKNHIVLTFTVILVPSLLLGAFLTIRFFHVAESARSLREASNAVTNWLGPVDSLVRVSISGSTVHIAVEGSEQPPSIDNLTPVLSGILGRPSTVDLQWTPTQQGTTPINPSQNISVGQLTPIVESWIAEQQLHLDALSYVSGVLNLSLSGPNPPKSADDLAARFLVRFNVRIPINLNWKLAVPGDGSVTVADAETARKLAEVWTQKHPDVIVIDSTQSGTTITVTLSSTKVPRVADLKKILHSALPNHLIKIEWVARRVLAKTSPSTLP